MMKNPSSRIDRSQNRRSTPEYDNARDRYMKSLQASIERRERRRAAEQESGSRSALSAQEAAQQARRDKQQQLYEQANTGQRAYYAANAAADDFARAQKLNKQQQKDVRRRDTLQAGFTTQRDREQSRDQLQRDRLLNDLSMRENEQKFGFQTQENDQQFGQQIQRDRFQHGNTLERDYMQFGFDSARAGQQQRNQLERDSMLNQFATEEDLRQNEFQAQRDNRLNMFDANRDARQQQYEQQNLYQRETADVAARWQEQVQAARNAGMDFSEAQKKEMNELDKAFRKHVLNGDLDEGLKQQAMLQHQKALAAFIPDQRVQNPQEGLNQSVIFHEPTGTWFMQGRDSRGFPTFEPLGKAGEDPAQIQQMQEKQRQLQEKQAETQRKALLERQREFMGLVQDKMSEEDALGNRLYPDREAAIKAAQQDYAPMEELWRQSHNLPPMYELPSEAKPAVNPPPADNGNPYRRQAQGMADSLAARSGDPRMDSKPKPPVLSYNAPLPSQVADSLRNIPGGNQLKAIREKHSSKQPKDQTVRLAADIVINALMTNDTSDPDYEESLKILKGAGYNVGK